MRLEELHINIDHVQFGASTAVDGHTLTINKSELTALILEDDSFVEVDVDIAVPGTSCRVVNVADIIEPRYKTAGGGQVFPGTVSPMEQVGCGKTIVLNGVTVMETWQYPLGPMQAMLDMSGPAAELTPFSKYHHVVLITQPRTDLSRIEYTRSLKKASLKTALYLAEKAATAAVDRVAVYDLHAEKVVETLPRVAYVCQFYSIRQADEPLVYGHNAKTMIPSIMHPNEFLDGAVVNNDYDNLRISEVTFTHQNHPVISELYRRHGKDLNFVGVIIKDAPLSLDDKKRSALMAAKLAKWYLEADGVILTKEGGGHPQLDLSLTADACAAWGIEAVIMISEFMSSSGKRNEMTLFNTKAANAVVSCGRGQVLPLPKMDQVIGMRTVDDPQDPAFEAIFQGGVYPNQHIRGILSQCGINNLSTVEL